MRIYDNSLWSSSIDYFMSLFFFFNSASRKERLFLVRTFWLYRIIIKFLFFGFSFVLFFTNSFLSVLPACNII
uniref:Uncharacterized protein n=1 Tax=Leptobrachium leishanense TaxID=445787 RepID=A0A8C5LQP2_9ANUR